MAGGARRTGLGREWVMRLAVWQSPNNTGVRGLIWLSLRNSVPGTRALAAVRPSSYRGNLILRKGQRQTGSFRVEVIRGAGGQAVGHECLQETAGLQLEGSGMEGGKAYLNVGGGCPYK